jgi:hypothetical protein
LTGKLCTLVTCATALSISLAANAGNLYSWKAKDGTPTYSPDPPPPGTVYTIVGPDLEPITRYQQPSNSAPVTATTEVPAAAKPKWKPVIYADAPATGGQPEPIRASKSQKSTPSTPARMTAVAGSHGQCLELRRLIAGLENSFARANSNAEMDQAILALQEQTDLYDETCR